VLIADEIRSAINGRSSEDQQLDILSVACGPANELADIFVSDKYPSLLNLTLLDQDDEALREALSTVKGIEKKIGFHLNVSYVKESVRILLKHRELHEKLGQFDFIYSMGLFDYLTPPVARVVANRLFSLLKPGGKIVIGNFHLENQSKWFMEYWHDWVLYYRDQDEMRSMIKSSEKDIINVIFEDTRNQMFLIAEKGK